MHRSVSIPPRPKPFLMNQEPTSLFKINDGWRDNPCGYTLRGERVAFRAASSARFVGKKLRRPSVREDCFLYSHHARFWPPSRHIAPPHDLGR
jgi:hypothetical protein